MLRDNHRRATTARIVFLLLLLITGGVTLCSILSLAAPDLLAQSPMAGGLLLMAYGLLVIAEAVVNLVALIVLIMWLRRAYYNLHQLPGIHPEFSDGWAAGAWFVPFIGLWRPYSITREVWNDTQVAAVGQVGRPATILGWWWAAYLVRLVVSQITSVVIDGKNGFSGDDSIFLMASAVATFVFAALTRHVISRVEQFEEQLVLSQRLAQLGQPAPAYEVDAALAAEQPNYGQPEGY